MPIPLFGKLISGTGNPYADADQVEIVATGFDGNLTTSTVNVQQLAQAVDDLTLPGALITEIETHTATGTQNYAQEVTNRLHVLQSTVTAFDLMTSATVADDGWFAIYNGNTAAIEFDISAHAVSFAGSASGNTDAYSIAGGATVLFNVKGTSVYPIADTGAAGGAAGSDDHPVVLTRNTPTLTQLNSLAQESLNDNSGLWIVASDQDATFESGIDSSIMIRSLRSGILDANGAQLSTTAVAKSGVRLAGGTVVRVFSQTDLRVVSGPLMAAGSRYPDIPTTLTVGGILDLRGNQVIYNSYRNRTATFDINLSGFASVYLPSLQNAVDLAYLNRNDVFCFRHIGTNGTIRVRTFQVGTIFNDGTQQIELSPGETLCVTPAPSGAVWQIVVFGQSTDINLETITINTDWYRDGVEATAANNSVRLHNREEIVEGNVINHVYSSSSTNNPVSVRWNQIDSQDDIAWIQFWTTWDSSVPALGASVEEIKANIPTAISYIETNINNGFDFEFEAPDSVLTIQSIGHVTGNEVRYVLHSNFISSSFSVNHPIRIQGAANAVHNGVFELDSIGTTGSNVTLHVTNPSVSDGTLDESSTSAFVGVPVWVDCVLVSHDLRQVNMNLYSDSLRTSLRTAINSQWFDHTLDPVTIDSVLNIGYNTDIETTAPSLALQHQDGNFYEPPHGALTRVHSLYNGDPNNNGPSEPDYLVRRPIPDAFRNVHIQTQGVAAFYFNTQSPNIPVGESRQYRVYSDPDNGDNDVSIGVGSTAGEGWSETFDGSILAYSLLPGDFVDIEGYNDGVDNGWRIVSPFEKTVPSINVYSTAIAAHTNYIAINSANQVLNTQNEDISRYLINTANDRLVMEASLEYHIRAKIDVVFNGTEGTGLQFVDCQLMPRRVRSATTTNLDQYADAAPLLYSRNGQSGSSAPKFRATLRCDFTYQALADDEIGFQVIFGTFPSGGSITDIQFQNWSWEITARGNL